MTVTSLDAWLRILEQRHPSAIDMGLERIGVVARALGVTGFDAPVITVGGTNGKGSTVATLVALARAAGWRVASYTSPHLLRFNERVCLDGEMISDADMVAALDAVEAVRGEVSLTYFEHTTLAAFWWFRHQSPDLIVLEVGLGGRLDAVNLVDASVAVITSVDLDHQDWLGDTRELIAREKAGILRPGAPVVFGEREPLPVLTGQAAKLAAPQWIKGRDYDFTTDAGTWHWHATTADPAGGPAWRDLPLPGVSCENAAVALAALRALAGVSALCIGEDAVRAGLPLATVPGRAQRLPGSPEVWLDVGHNPHGARFLWQQLPPARAGQRTHAVFAMLADKDIAGVIAASRAHVDHWWPAGLEGPRASSGEAMAGHLHAAGIVAEPARSGVAEALMAARQTAGADDRIVVFGSFLTVAAVLASGG